MKSKPFEITPEKYQCGIGACPAIFEITPPEYKCVLGACPSAFEDTENSSYLIIGTKVDPKDLGLSERVGEGEVLIKIPKGILEDIVKK